MKKTLPFLSFSLSFSLSFFLFFSFFIFCVPTGVAMATQATPSNTPLHATKYDVAFFTPLLAPTLIRNKEVTEKQNKIEHERSDKNRHRM